MRCWDGPITCRNRDQLATITFLETALAEGRRYEEKVTQDLSSVVFDRVFPKVIEALADTAGASLPEVRATALIFLYRSEVQESVDLFRGVEDTTAVLRGFLDFVCGLRWLTAGMNKSQRDSFATPLTEALEASPDDAYQLLSRGPASGQGKSPFGVLWSEAISVAKREGFLHWHVAFPGVWRRWQAQRPEGGFDAIIGNPPWDRIKLQEVEWFATRAPAVALLPTAAQRKEAISW